MKEKQNAIRISKIDKIVMIFLIFTQFIVFFYSLILLLNYQTNIFKPYINYASIADISRTENHYLYNIFLLALFWVQHIGMATLKYKIVIFSTTKKFILYQRYIYNISSGLTLWFIFSHIKPSYQFVFSTPQYLNIPLVIIGVILVLISTIQLGGGILMPYSIKSILKNEELTFKPYAQKNNEELTVVGLYAYTRNPMQCGALLTIIFGNNIYTIDSLIFIGIFSAGVILGVLMEQKRMKFKFLEYEDYMKKVKARFIPFII